jgi:TetR/AcrR family transcriptional regulator
MAQPARRTPRAERTRSAILDAAETLFAERGFDATRLEDVAERVGIRRASIVYYFRDKGELYDAVLAGVFGGLFERTRETLGAPGPLATRIESAVAAWVDYVGARPSLARLLLREVANGAPERRRVLARHTQPFFALTRKVMGESRGDPLAQSPPIDPVHFASTIAGATVFLVAAMPALVPELGFGPLQREQIEAHGNEVLRITRRLLGTGEPRTGGRPQRRQTVRGRRR